MTRMKVNKLRWFGQVERMSEERLTKGIYAAERCGVRGRDCPQDQVLKEGNVRSAKN